jgi:hypothetical protein
MGEHIHALIAGRHATMVGKSISKMTTKANFCFFYTLIHALGFGTSRSYAQDLDRILIYVVSQNAGKQRGA